MGPDATLSDFIPRAGSILIRDGADIGALDYQPSAPPVIPAALQTLANDLASQLGADQFNNFTVTLEPLGTPPPTYQLSFQSTLEFNNTAQSGMLLNMTVTFSEDLSILSIRTSHYGPFGSIYVPEPDGQLLYDALAYTLEQIHAAPPTLREILETMTQTAILDFFPSDTQLLFHIGETIYGEGTLYQFDIVSADPQ